MQHEVDLAVLVGVIARRERELTAKLLQDVVLCQRPFELEVAFEENRTVVDARHVLQQPRIEEEELELVEPVEGR